jgi:hypothetical protein
MKSAVKATIRIIVIFVFIQSLITLINYISNFIYAVHHIYSENYDILFSLAVPIGSLLLGIFILYIIWWKTDWLVKVLAGELSDNELTISTSNLDLMKVALRILGIFLLVNSIPNLLGLIGYHYSFPEEMRRFSTEIYANEIKNYIIVGVKIIFGVWLSLGTKDIHKIFNVVDDKVHMGNNPEQKGE